MSMSEVTRRSVLRGVGVSAVAVTAGALVPAAATAATASHPDAAGKHAEASMATLVAFVKNTGTGEITVMSGDHEVAVTDRKLAAQLARLLG
jgi:hypothetical protein